MIVRIGTRGSDLALWQARHVAARLEAADCEVEIVVLKTRGDRIDDVPLQTLEGKAFFTAEIEEALLEERVDLAVHSHKDLPVEGPPGLEIIAVPERANPGERLLLAPDAHDPAAPFLPVALGRTIGTSAPRRSEQLLALRPDLVVANLRGNVPTRVRRLREGNYHGILLAAAGLSRLELDTSDLVDVPLETELFVPAPAQGALAIQARAVDHQLVERVRALLDDETTRATVRAERQLLTEAGGGCSLPLGCTLEPHAGGWRARAFLGVDQPVPGTLPRWAETRDEDPERAARKVYELLRDGAPTHCGPFAGRRIAITGAASQGTQLGARLEILGAEVVHERVLAFETVTGPAPAERVAKLSPGDALAVTSKEAARRLTGVRVPPGVVVGAVGSATQHELQGVGIEVSHVGVGGARELARSLPIAPGKCALFPCAQDALADLEQGLSQRGVSVERLPLYRTVALPAFELARDVDTRVYMSPSAVAVCVAQERALGDTARTRVALGRATAGALEHHGLAFQAPGPGGVEAVVHLLAQPDHPQEANQ